MATNGRQELKRFLPVLIQNADHHTGTRKEKMKMKKSKYGNYTVNKKKLFVFIYGIKCCETGSVLYVGSTIEPFKRFSYHVSYNGKHKNEDIFLYFFEIAKREERKQREYHWIKEMAMAGEPLQNISLPKLN